jgi:hypothetical protein
VPHPFFSNSRTIAKTNVQRELKNDPSFHIENHIEPCQDFLAQSDHSVRIYASLELIDDDLS